MHLIKSFNHLIYGVGQNNRPFLSPLKHFFVILQIVHSSFVELLEIYNN